MVDNLSVDINTKAGILHAVSNVSFELKPGETLCIVGESGSGKSMTALAIMGLLPRTAIRKVNKLMVDGCNLLNISDGEKSDFLGSRMAMIFQEPMTSLNPCFTIGYQMVETLVRHRNVSKLEAKKIAAKWLERVGIPSSAGRLDQYPHQLSGGLRQRVMIAMMLICNPKLLIADEPTTALDVTVQIQILQLLTDLQRELGLGLIFITHDLGLVSRIADKVAVMYAGQIIEFGTTKQILDSPEHPYTRGLIDCLPAQDKTRKGKYFGTIPGYIPSLIGDIEGCRFYNRCKHAKPICNEQSIILSYRENERHVRCMFKSHEL